MFENFAFLMETSLICLSLFLVILISSPITAIFVPFRPNNTGTY